MRTILFDVGNTLFHVDYAFIVGVLAEHGHAVEPDALRVAEYVDPLGDYPGADGCPRIRRLAELLFTPAGTTSRRRP